MWHWKKWIPWISGAWRLWQHLPNEEKDQKAKMEVGMVGKETKRREWGMGDEGTRRTRF